MQLDVKLKNGVPLELLEKALDKAKEGRQKILTHMHERVAAQEAMRLGQPAGWKENRVGATEHTSPSHVVVMELNWGDAAPNISTWFGGEGFGGAVSGQYGLKAQAPLGVIVKFDPERRKHLLGLAGTLVLKNPTLHSLSFFLSFFLPFIFSSMN
jgi:hypothetical protein